jgi:hypothetical protein
MSGENTFAIHEAERELLSHEEWLIVATDTPPVGAHVVTSRTGYTHHGIYVGDCKVVHYSGLSRGWRRGPIEEVSLPEFSRGRPVRVRSQVKPRFDRNDVIARARSRLGEDRYTILSNNCEHFCEWCLNGQSRSPQIERWFTRPRSALLAALKVLRRSADVHSLSILNTGDESEAQVDGLTMPQRRHIRASD